jgi:hypothetical protein
MDDRTFKKVLGGTVVGIVIAFVVYSVIQIRNENKIESSLRFPPWPAKCPDFWSVEGDENILKCRNVYNIGKCKNFDGVNPDSNVMDFSEDIFKGENGMYYKCDWSRKCEAPWEGVDKTCV